MWHSDRPNWNWNSASSQPHILLVSPRCRVTRDLLLLGLTEREQLRPIQRKENPAPGGTVRRCHTAHGALSCVNNPSQNFSEIEIFTLQHAARHLCTTALVFPCIKPLGHQSSVYQISSSTTLRKEMMIRTMRIVLRGCPEVRFL